MSVTSVVDHVHAQLRSRILSGSLKPGERLNQGALAEELGVSRTPLREALRLLATDGLVSIENNRGARVRGADSEDLATAWVARLTLEPAAAKLAATVREPSAVNDMRSAIADDNDHMFHYALVACAGNQYLESFAERLLQRVTPTFRGIGDRTDEPTAPGHRLILQAVERGMMVLAEERTRAHLEIEMATVRDLQR